MATETNAIHSGETSFDPNNLTGQLFMKGKRENTFLQMIGGMGSIVGIKSKEFDCGQDYEIPDHRTLPDRLEGGLAPAFAGVERTPSKNILEVLHETIAATYTQRGASQQMTQGVGAVLNGGAANPVQDEFEFQAGVVMEREARRMNYRLLRQTYRNPGLMSTSRRTRGMLEAVTTNVVDATEGGEAQNLTRKHFDTLLAMMIESGATTDGDDLVMLCNTSQMVKINELYSPYNHNSGIIPSRDVGGVSIRTIYTAFGTLSFVLERDLPQDTLLYTNFGVVGLRGLEIPGKPGLIFREKLGKRGSLDEEQIYGEVGLQHGPEWLHGVIKGLKAD